MNNSENIPSHIFDWLEKTSFSSLNQLQQTEVLIYFPEKEYDELHHSLLAVKKVTTLNRPARKQELLDAFENKHKIKQRDFLFMLHPGNLWKAAAILLLLGAGWLLNYWLPIDDQSAQKLLHRIDTIYLTKDPEPSMVKIYDTVYFERFSPFEVRKKTGVKTPVDIPELYDETDLTNDMSGALSISDFDSLPNKQKRNSLKDDSLIRKYSIISM